ncbi:acid phosphatase [Irpex rosettiformis]|uniref:Acid phosphatase n=1 Tax=Irpex rosettiformis TaxID=378272 RepID=A0ACB8TUH3_9APHY|nr:acid phosphatase [Irpex rosettiformis]
MYLQVALASLFVTAHCQTKVVLTNDDGWAVAQIRAQNDALKAAGYNVILSAPAENQSGTGSNSATPTPLTEPCQFDSCPAGSPAEGFNASDPRLNYVNAFPVDAVKFGIQTLSPMFFDSAPDFVVSGPNIGFNLGPGVSGSGTVGAACEASKEGIPSIAVSGESTSSKSYTTLQSDPNSLNSLASEVNSQLTVKLVNALLASPARPVLPSDTILNINFSPVLPLLCPSADDYKFVLTRLIPDPFHLAKDVNTCGSDHLQDEIFVMLKTLGRCHVTISVIDATTKADVDATRQAAVLDRLSSILSCL